MAKKYIKNCTESEAGKEAASSRARSVSASLSRLIFDILFIGFLAVLAYALFFSQFLKITKIDVFGNKELSTGEIRQAIGSHMEGNFFGIIPKNNFLFFPQKKVVGILEDSFKKIRSVSVVRKFPDSLSITIDEHKALLIWCSNGECFILDEDGMAYNNADFNAPELSQNNLIKIEDASARNLAIGEKVISSSYEQYALSIKNALNKVGFNVNGYYTPSSVAEEIDIRTEQGTEIYFSTQFPLESAIKTLEIVLKKEIPGDQKEKIAYIDLRSENKVFYKLKDSQPEDGNADLQNQDKPVIESKE